jgi:hypothetical protein
LFYINADIIAQDLRDLKNNWIIWRVLYSKSNQFFLNFKKYQRVANVFSSIKKNINRVRSDPT